MPRVQGLGMAVLGIGGWRWEFGWQFAAISASASCPVSVNALCVWCVFSLEAFVRDKDIRTLISAEKYRHARSVVLQQYGKQHASSSAGSTVPSSADQASVDGHSSGDELLPPGCDQPPPEAAVALVRHYFIISVINNIIIIIEIRNNTVCIGAL